MFYQTLAEQIGVTDEVTTCSCCGKEGLKRTVVFKTHDGDFAYLGTTCATKAVSYRGKATKVNAQGQTEAEQEKARFEAFVQVNIARLMVKDGYALPDAWALIKRASTRPNWHFESYVGKLEPRGIIFVD